MAVILRTKVGIFPDVKNKQNMDSVKFKIRVIEIPYQYIWLVPLTSMFFIIHLIIQLQLILTTTKNSTNYSLSYGRDYRQKSMYLQLLLFLCLVLQIFYTCMPLFMLIYCHFGFSLILYCLLNSMLPCSLLIRVNSDFYPCYKCEFLRR